MTYKNIELERMLSSVAPHLGRRDLIGYVCARNYRAIADALADYVSVKNALLAECGEVGSDGVPRISTAAPRYAEFARRFAPIADVEQEVAVMPLRYVDVVGELTGEEILEIDWMLED